MADIGRMGLHALILAALNTLCIITANMQNQKAESYAEWYEQTTRAYWIYTGCMSFTNMFYLQLNLIFLITVKYDFERR